MERNSPFGIKYLEKQLQQDVFTVKGRYFKIGESDEKEVNINFILAGGIGVFKNLGTDNYVIFHPGTLYTQDYPMLCPENMCTKDHKSCVRILFHLEEFKYQFKGEGIIIDDDQLVPIEVYSHTIM